MKQAKDYINRCKWRWAKTYLDVPHEYIIRGRCALGDEEFNELIDQCHASPIREWFGKRNGPYLYPGDGYKYWTCSMKREGCNCINRQKVFAEYDTLPDACVKTYTEEQLREVCKQAKQFIGSSCYEIGYGDGSHIPHLDIEPKNYRGCNPSKRVTKIFRHNAPLYAKRVRVSSFEEAHATWSRSEAPILALFGSASYVMREYLQMLRSRNCFLMFFAGEAPKELRGTHYFDYSEEDIRGMYPEARVSEWGEYLIVENGKRAQSVYQQTLF